MATTKQHFLVHNLIALRPTDAFPSPVCPICRELYDDGGDDLTPLNL